MKIHLPCMNYIRLLVLILLAGILLTSVGAIGDNEKSEGTVLAVYIIGSNLEFDPQKPFDPSGAATKDIKEMVTGYGDGTAGLDVLVGYGGSLKPGWKGLTIATLKQISDDLADGAINGTAPSLLQDESANMATPETLTRFIQFIGEHSPGKRILFVFWDHGGAWKGFGGDMNFIDPVTGESSMLSLDDISKGLSDAGYRFDLIGFDACLMANLEVATSVAPHGDLLVASEEIEPGFGWDWTAILKALVENPAIPASDLGRVIVDSYMDNPAHTSEPKTLSVIDLTKIEGISKRFNAFSSDLGGKISDPEHMEAYSKAIIKMPAFGTYSIKSGETFEYTVDLSDYLTSVRKNNPGLSGDIDDLIDDLNATILYAREDGSRPTAKGLSIYSPYTAILVSQNKVDPPPQRLLAGFDELLERFIGELRKDTRRIPEIIEDKSGYQIPENASVSVELTFIQNTNESMVILGTEPAYPDKPGRYPFPKWGGWGIMWKDESAGTSLVIPVKFMGSTPSGRERYEAYGKITRDEVQKSVRFDFYYEPHTGETTYYITPYTITGKATPVFERSTWKMEPGDTLTMLATHRLRGSGSERVEEYGSITWTDDMRLGYGMLPCGYTYTIIFDVYDVTRKSIYQDFTDVKVPCLNETESEIIQEP